MHSQPRYYVEVSSQIQTPAIESPQQVTLLNL
jgi:hypothetical protein